MTFINSPVMVSKYAHQASYSHNNKIQMSQSGKLTRKVAFFIFIASFGPYFLPPDRKPDFYKVNPVPTNRRANNYIGGNLDLIPWDNLLQENNLTQQKSIESYDDDNGS